MKKVLILCRDFPPLNTVAAQRIESWVKLLPFHDILPIVIAPSWKDGIIHHEQKFSNMSAEDSVEDTQEYIVYRVIIKPSSLKKWIAKKGLSKGKFIRKLLTFKHLIGYYLGQSSDELFPIQTKAKQILQEESVDLILSSGEPFNLFKFSSSLSNEFNIPWIADFRDEWSDNHTKKRSVLSKKIIRYFENRWIKSASALMSVSEPINDRLKRKFDKDSYVVMNGFDAGVKPPENETNEHYFELVYSGTLYDAKYLDVLELGLKQLNSLNLPLALKLIFIGSDLNETEGTKRVRTLAKEYKEIDFEDLLTYEQYISRINKSDAALNMIPGSLSQGIYGTKIFDYLSVDLPVIHIETEPDSLPEGFDKFLFPAANAETFTTLIQDMMEKKTKGINYEPAYSSEWKMRYSRQNQAKKLSEVIQHVLNEK